MTSLETVQIEVKFNHLKLPNVRTFNIFGRVMISELVNYRRRRNTFLTGYTKKGRFYATYINLVPETSTIYGIWPAVWTSVGTLIYPFN